jgi:hypothetical protein
MNKMLRKLIFILFICLSIFIIPVYSDSCIITNNVNQNLNYATYTIGSYNTVLFDDNNLVYNSTTIKINNSGYYLVQITNTYGIKTGYTSVVALINGTTERLVEESTMTYSTSYIDYYYSGTTIQLRYWTNQNGNSLVYGSYCPRFAVSSIGTNLTVVSNSGENMTTEQFDLLTALLIMIIMLLGCVSFIKIFDYIMAEKEDK